MVASILPVAVLNAPSLAWVVPGAIALVGCAAIVGGLAGSLWRWWRGVARCRCPGPLLGWRARLIPTWVVYRPRCGYDLSGHRARDRGVVANPAPFVPVSCPECGRRIRRASELRRTTGAWRPTGVGCTCLLVAAYLHARPPVDPTRLVAMASTNVLLDGEGAFGVHTPIEVREELRTRAESLTMDDRQLRRFVELLVRDLRDDTLVENAKDALTQLAIYGMFCEEPLFDALRSDDQQQRALAAEVLRGIPRSEPPPIELLAASVSQLGSDDRRWNASDAWGFLAGHLDRAAPLLVPHLDAEDEQLRTGVRELLRMAPLDLAWREDLTRASVEDLGGDRSRGTAGGAFRWLIGVAGEAEPALRAGMRSTDPRRRFLSAAVAGCAGRNALLEEAVPLLVDSLRDNDVTGDATIACRSLWGFGREVVPHLERAIAIGGLDEQARECLLYLVARSTTTESVLRLQARYPWARTTLKSRDAMDLDPASLTMPRWPDPEP